MSALYKDLGAPMNNLALNQMVGLFSGVGGFELAGQRAGLEVVASCEIDKKGQEVLKSKFPFAQHFGNVEELTGEDLINAGFNPKRGIITAGFPCQDLSVAGRRAGLAGERSKLFWQIERILSETKAQGFVIENVPGLLTSNRGRDFGIILAALAELGYSLAWRVLDAQNFGIPQRRRRVFIVGYLGDDTTPRQVLFERESEPWHHTSLRASRARTASAAKTGLGAPSWAVKTTRSGARDAEGNLPPEVWTEKVVHPTLNLNDLGESRAVALVFDPHRADGVRLQGNVIRTLTAFMGTGGNNAPMVAKNNAVRRITPVECERLQGFPDGWTAGQADSHRYKQLGNAVAVPVVEWILNRFVYLTNRERAL